MPAMVGRALILLVAVLLTADLAVPWWPGVFSFENDDLFIATVIEGKAKETRPLAVVAVPRTVIAARVREITPRLPAVTTSPSLSRPRAEARRGPSARVSLASPASDDH